MDLPDETLDDILRRVPPRHLTACRRVCENWRAVIDGRGLVLAHLAPGPVRGIFINHAGKESHSFFSRAAAPPSDIDGALRFVPDRWMDRSKVLDHREGLLLCSNKGTKYVCNPATRRWVRLPPPPPHVRPFYPNRLYLMFDPTVSLHYDVLYFPGVPDVPKAPVYPPRKRPRHMRSFFVVCTPAYVESLPPSLRAIYEDDVKTVGSMEWPPSSYAVQVLSSRTGRWEERRFVREGDAVATVSEMWSNPCAPGSSAFRCHAVCWQGAFYLHCRSGFVMRFSLLEEKYLAIKTPILDTSFRRPTSHTNWYEEHSKPYTYLGKSKEGVYLTALEGYQLWVWVLHDEASESRRMPQWKLKHQADLKPSFLRHRTTRCHTHNSWILDRQAEADHGWDSGDDSVIDTQGQMELDDDKGYKRRCYYGVDLLGYHPYKEIAFLGNRYNGFAYYLGSSKLQYLGSLYPRGYRSRFPFAAPTLESFIYTPCMDDLLPAHDDEHVLHLI